MNTPSPLPRKVAKPRTRTVRKPKPTATPEATASTPTPDVKPTEAITPTAVAEPPKPVEEKPAEVKPAVAQPVEQPKNEKPAEMPATSPGEATQQQHDFKNRRDRHHRHGHRDERRQQHQENGQQSPNPHAHEMGPQTRNLTLLGSKNTVYSDQYTPAILEVFDNRHPENDYFVKFNCPEFTSLCPITGQPDFATIYISYIPDRRMVESKSLKLYLFSFRNHGAFHEDCVNIIMKDLIKLMAPRYIEVWGKFLPRGGLSIDPFANYGRPTTRWEEFARQRLLMHDLAPETIHNR